MDKQSKIAIFDARITTDLGFALVGVMFTA